MNVYRCWYQGIQGYSCRRGRGWMFVPELGQPDNRIHKNIVLTDLVFMNREEGRFEMNNETSRNKRSVRGWLGYMLGRRSRPHTVHGMLFTTR